VARSKWHPINVKDNGKAGKNPPPKKPLPTKKNRTKRSQGEPG